MEKSQRLADVGNVGIQGYDAALAADISAYQASHADVRFGGYLGTEFRNITFVGERPRPPRHCWPTRYTSAMTGGCAPWPQEAA